MNKQLPTDGIANEPVGSSVFFSQPAKDASSSKRPAAKLDEQPTAQKPDATMQAATIPPQEDAVVSNDHDTLVSRNHDTTPSVDQATADAKPESNDADLYEEVRKATRQFGKEAATHRFTVAEKRAIADIVYTYGCQDTKTSENEITRIAVNWLLLDYRQHGALSVLAQLLDSLHG